MITDKKLEELSPLIPNVEVKEGDVELTSVELKNQTYYVLNSSNIDPLAYIEPFSIQVGDELWNSDKDEYITTEYYTTSGSIGGGTAATTYRNAELLEIDPLISKIQYVGVWPGSTFMCFFASKTAAGVGSGFISSINKQNINKVQTLTIDVPEGTKYIGFSSSKGRYPQYDYVPTVISVAALKTAETLSDKMDAVQEVVDTVNNNMTSLVNTSNNKEFFQSLFKKVVCIGDSQTAGFRRAGGDQNDTSYPAFIKKYYGWDTDIKANGGLAPSTWYNRYAANITWTDYDAAIIWLGQNNGLTRTVAADIEAHDTNGIAGSGHASYATTETGYYGKIIGEALAANPSIQIFLIKGSANTSGGGTWSTVQDLADYFGVPALDIYNNKKYVNISEKRYHPCPASAFGTTVDIIHYGTLGYFALAKQIYYMVLDYLMEHENDYLVWDENVVIDCQGTDYSVIINGTTKAITTDTTLTAKWGSVVQVSGSGNITFNGTAVSNPYYFRIKDVLQISRTDSSTLAIKEYNKE